MRLFLGLPVPSGAFAAITDEARRTFPELRPVVAGTWHVTLRFLGEIFDQPAVEQSVSLAMRGRPALPCVVEGLGAFPNPKKASVLWAGVRAEGVDALATAIEHATREFGEPPERRRFVAHVTLGRFARPVDARSFLASHTNNLVAEGVLGRVVLYESMLDPGGAKHVPLRTWRLGSP